MVQETQKLHLASGWLAQSTYIVCSCFKACCILPSKVHLRTHSSRVFKGTIRFIAGEEFRGDTRTLRYEVLLPLPYCPAQVASSLLRSASNSQKSGKMKTSILTSIQNVLLSPVWNNSAPQQPQEHKLPNMKVYILFSSLLSLSHLSALTLAALPLVIPNASAWTSALPPHPANPTLNSSSGSVPPPSLPPFLPPPPLPSQKPPSLIPTQPSAPSVPDPFQQRIHGTSTSLILGKYGARVSALDLVGIVAKAQYQIVNAVVRARGDGPVEQPTFEWRHGRLYVRVEQQHRLELSWLVMAEALSGVLEFGYTFGFFGCEFTVLEDTVGVVGSGSVGVGYA